MNRLCKNLFTKSGLLARYVPTFGVRSETERCGLSSFALINSQQFALKANTRLANSSVFAINTSVRFNVSNTDFKTAQFKPRERSENSFGGSGGGGRFKNDRAPRQFVKEVGSEIDEFETEDASLEETASGATSDYSSKASNGFASFDLPAPLLERLVSLGYDKPFEIQEATLKHTLAGK